MVTGAVLYPITNLRIVLKIITFAMDIHVAGGYNGLGARDTVSHFTLSYAKYIDMSVVVKSLETTCRKAVIFCSP